MSGFKPLSLWVGAICLGSVSASENDQWRFELKPLYLWFLSMEGDTTLPAFGSEPEGTSNFDEGELTSAFSFHFEAAKGDWTVFTDYPYGQYSADNINISSSPIFQSNR